MQGFMNVKDLAKMLLKSEGTIRRWCRMKYRKIPCYYIGGVYLFKYVQVEKWLEEFRG